MSTGMECSCVCDPDYDGPEASSITHPRARKPHKCCECKGTILPGEEYERVWGIWDDIMDVFKTCMTCVRIRTDYCCSWAYSGLREDLWDALGVDYVTGRIREEEKE